MGWENDDVAKQLENLATYMCSSYAPYFLSHDASTNKVADLIGGFVAASATPAQKLGLPQELVDLYRSRAREEIVQAQNSIKSGNEHYARMCLSHAHSLIMAVENFSHFGEDVKTRRFIA